MNSFEINISSDGKENIHRILKINVQCSLLYQYFTSCKQACFFYWEFNMSFELKRIKINYFINTIGKLSLMHNITTGVQSLTHILSLKIPPYFTVDFTCHCLFSPKKCWLSGLEVFCTCEIQVQSSIIEDLSIFTNLKEHPCHI